MMSNTARWIIGVLLVLVGIAAAVFVIFGGAFSTVGCVKVPPEWVYYVLILSGIVTLAATLIPAILLIRRAKGSRVVLILVLGLILSCSGYGIYFYLLGQNC
jgi:hypothetical protein